MESITTYQSAPLNAIISGISVIDIAFNDIPTFQKSFSISIAARRFPGSNAMKAVPQRNGPAAFANGQKHMDASPITCTDTNGAAQRLNVLDMLLPLLMRVTVLFPDPCFFHTAGLTGFFCCGSTPASAA